MSTIVPVAGSVLKTGIVDRNESDSQDMVGPIRSKESGVYRSCIMRSKTDGGGVG